MPDDQDPSDHAVRRRLLAAACILALIAVHSFFAIATGHLIPCTENEKPLSVCSIKSTLNGIDFNFALAETRSKAGALVYNMQTAERDDATLWARNFYGRSSFAVATSFIFLTCAVALVFSLSVSFPSSRPRNAAAFSGFVSIVTLIFAGAVFFFVEDKFGFDFLRPPGQSLASCMTSRKA
jgi:hypothetical protein